jgi:hypothetical protein
MDGQIDAKIWPKFGQKKQQKNFLKFFKEKK